MWISTLMMSDVQVARELSDLRDVGNQRILTVLLLPLHLRQGQDSNEELRAKVMTLLGRFIAVKV